MITFKNKKAVAPISEVYLESTLQWRTSTMELFCENNYKSYFCKKLHRGYLTGFSIQLCVFMS